LYKNVAEFECQGQISKVKVTVTKGKTAESSPLTMHGKVSRAL